jgi:diguanylate cyclase (GGDEF)-like protein
MRRWQKVVIIVIIAVAIVTGIGIGLYTILVDENSLSIKEKEWLDNNKSKVLSIAIPNDLPVFGNTGAGVFFDFVNYVSDDLGIDVNKNTISYLTESEGYGFYVSNSWDSNSLLLYKDHYVLISKTNGIINDGSKIKDLKAGVLNTNLDIVANYYGVSADHFKSYESYNAITEALGNGDVAYAIVPLNEYKDKLISNRVNIIYHISDLNRYYYFRLSDNDMYNNILKKTFNSWKEKKYNDSYDKNNYNLFVKQLGITEAEEAQLTSKTYAYGFAENAPYEILASGEYGGITAQYLNSFSKFSNVEFTFKKYKNPEELAKAAIENKINLYYNYYNLTTNYIDAGALNTINYEIIADNSIDLSLTNISGLANQEVYVQENSYLFDAIKEIDGITIKTYKNTSDLRRLLKGKHIIILDENVVTYYVYKNNNNYSVRYRGYLTDNTYAFRYENDSDPFYRLFSAYTKTIDPSDLVRMGVTTYNKVNRRGTIITNIAFTVLVVIGSAILLSTFVFKKRRRLNLNTKVKKEDRIKYIDLLTSLKNRNYYNEKIKVWNKNRVYPQACIVLDCNRVKELNDLLGHEEGDKQIQAVSNVLIRTQVDNSEIMRTDGNEFFVYMVGYSEKQVLSYMKRLVKGFKKLPHDYGVAMGFSMIENDTKLVEDAFNEASIKMRENKDLEEERHDK